MSSASTAHLARPLHLPSRCRALGRLARVGGLLSLLLSARAAAQPPPPAAASEPKDPRARAGELFFQGVAQMDAGDWYRALDFFRRSRQEVFTWESTKNAAFCLEKLNREDEALEMYEEVLTSSGAPLDAPQRAEGEAATAYLKKKVASLEITASAGGRITIDGRPRGELPRDRPLLLRVTAGKHLVRVLNDAYRPFERTVEVNAGAGIVVYAELKRVAPPPPSPPPPRPHQFLTAFAGAALGGSLNSTAESNDVVAHPPVRGFVGGMRGGYRTEIGFAFEVSLGYLSVLSPFSRKIPGKFFDQKGPTDPDSGVFDISYEPDHALQLHGPFLGLGVSQRLELTDRIGFLLRTTVGVLAASSTDRVTGTVSTPTGRADAVARGNNQAIASTSGLVMPEIGLESTWGNLHAGVFLGLIVLTANGPSFTGRAIGVAPTECSGSPAGSVHCVPNELLRKDNPEYPIQQDRFIDQTYGKFATLWTPQVMVTYSF